jgi:acyl-CoA hydrolase
MTSGPLRKLANTGRLDFVDMHLSHVAQMIMEGFLGRVDFAVIKATDITADGRVYLTTGIGNSPTFLHKAEKVIIELNAYHSQRLRELADTDLRGLSPIARARRIIDQCAHPAYRDYLHHYLESAPMGHIRHDLRRCYELYINLQE